MNIRAFISTPNTRTPDQSRSETRCAHARFASLARIIFISALTLSLGTAAHALQSSPAAKPKPSTKPSSPSSTTPATTKPASPTPRTGTKEGIDGFAQQLNDAASNIITSLGRRPTKELNADAQAIWNLCVQYLNPKSHAETFVRAAAALRLTAFVASAGDGAKASSLRTLAANPQLATTLGLAAAKEDNAADVLEVLDRLTKMYPEQVQDSAGLQSLVVATCVVFDTPPRRRPQTAAELQLWAADAFESRPADPLEVFGFFSRNRSRMLFPIDRMPVQALIHVVNTPCTPAELDWALKNFAGNATVGKLYDRIRYDTQNFKYNKPKKIIGTDGYTLMNIQKVGGVCVEQTFFAANVGKAIGVPTASVDAQGPEIGHAYVGYLRGAGSNTAWDFSEGRYDEYEEIRGNITDPQTGKRLHDGQVALSGGMMIDKPADRDAAIALADAAGTLMSATGFPPTPGKLDLTPPLGSSPRTPGVEAAESFLIESIERCPHAPGAWQCITALSKAGRLDDKRVRFWSDALLRFTLRPPSPNPDFAYDTLESMFVGIKDAKQQSALWDWAAQRFSSRVDLAGKARIAQARMWMANKDPGRAWTIYEQLIRTSRNEGTVIVDALADAERLLSREAKPDTAAIPLYETAFKRIGKPQKVSDQFRTSSNYYRIGERLSQLYDSAGKSSDSERLRKQIDVVETP